MAEVPSPRLSSASEDDVVEIQTQLQATNSRLESLENQLDSFGAAPSIQGISPGRSRSSRRSDRRLPSSQPQWTPALPAEPQMMAVIDLTEEPDSPPLEQRQSQPLSQMSRNPRRTNSQRITPPSLSRSDSTFMEPGANVIDLTEDTPEDGQTSEPRITRSHRHHHHHHHHHHQHQPRSLWIRDPLLDLTLRNARDPLLDFTLRSTPSNGGTLSERYSGIARSVRHVAAEWTNFMTRGFSNTPIEYGQAFVHREPSPKPPMEPAPPTRDGFTRDTCSTEERVVICPACNEELAYDPGGEASRSKSTVASGKKRKRAAGEQHFWALKKCGHVYCADCFENRRPTKAYPDGVGFRLPPLLPNRPQPSLPSTDIRCAVSDCDTKAAAKTEWVGIFL